MFGFEPDAAQCARAGCRETATASVVWRNPRIHTPDRRKVWLACPDHVSYLEGFLASRGFPVVVAAGVVDGSGVELPEAAA
nr:hypothetical protein [Microbacterium indicum]